MPFYSRKSIRLKGYDYSSRGIYFVTLLCYQRENLFGEVIDGSMILNDLGKIAHQNWLKTPEIRPNISLGEFVIMPNHIHGILSIDSEYLSTDSYDQDNNSVGDKSQVDISMYGSRDESKGELQFALTESTDKDNIHSDVGHQLKGPSQTIGAIIRGYKGQTTKEIKALLQSQDMKVWQRDYYDIIIRTQKDYFSIVNYIKNNTLKWCIDKYNL